MAIGSARSGVVRCRVVTGLLYFSTIAFIAASSSVWGAGAGVRVPISAASAAAVSRAGGGDDGRAMAGLIG